MAAASPGRHPDTPSASHVVGNCDSVVAFFSANGDITYNSSSCAPELGRAVAGEGVSGPDGRGRPPCSWWGAPCSGCRLRSPEGFSRALPTLPNTGARVTVQVSNDAGDRTATAPGYEGLLRRQSPLSHPVLREHLLGRCHPTLHRRERGLGGTTAPSWGEDPPENSSEFQPPKGSSARGGALWFLEAQKRGVKPQLPIPPSLQNLPQAQGAQGAVSLGPTGSRCSFVGVAPGTQHCLSAPRREVLQRPRGQDRPGREARTD